MPVFRKKDNACSRYFTHICWSCANCIRRSIFAEAISGMTKNHCSGVAIVAGRNQTRRSCLISDFEWHVSCFLQTHGEPLRSHLHDYARRRCRWRGGWAWTNPACGRLRGAWPRASGCTSSRRAHAVGTAGWDPCAGVWVTWSPPARPLL